MSMFEYVTILTSIIVGLGIAHLLQGLARLVQHPGRAKLYWVHLLWVFFTFFLAIFWWWWEFAFEAVATWTFELYVFVLFFAVLIYVLCALLFPSDLKDYSGFRDYYLSRRRWFFGCLGTYFLVDLADTWLKGAEYFASLGTEYLVANLIQLALCVIAMVTRNERFHGGFALLAVLYQLAQAVRFYGVVG